MRACAWATALGTGSDTVLLTRMGRLLLTIWCLLLLVTLGGAGQCSVSPRRIYFQNREGGGPATPNFLSHSVSLSSSSHSDRRPPIVVLHGLLGSCRNFQLWCRLLSQKTNNERDIIVLDLPCHGRTVTLGSFVLDFKSMAEDVVYTLCKLGIERAHIIGHSLGGKVCCKAVLMYHENGIDFLSCTMMDISPVNYEGSEEFKEVLGCIDFLQESHDKMRCAASKNEALEIIRGSIKDPVLQQFLASNIAPRPSTLEGFEWKFLVDGIASSKQLIQGFPEEQETPYNNPALILKGSLSKFVKARHLPAISKLMPLYTLSTIDGAGHWLHFEKPDAVADAVAQFLSAAEDYTLSKG